MQASIVNDTNEHRSATVVIPPYPILEAMIDVVRTTIRNTTHIRLVVFISYIVY